MRHAILLVGVLLPVGLFHAQGGTLLQELEVRDPMLSAAIVSSESAGDCQSPDVESWGIPAGYFGCSLLGTDFGSAIAADGTLIQWSTDSQNVDPNCPSFQRNALRVITTRPTGETQEALRVYTLRFHDCSGVSATTYFSANARVVFDVTSGRLLIYRDITITDYGSGQTIAHDRGVVAVSGFPAMFDALLTFIPGGQLAAIMPAHPDGFRAADAVQVWTGDVRSMPDWSQAQPLTCDAAVNPAPGQVVTVADTLPAPAVGSGRYYVTASQHGADRRLGRQYVNGAFSARDPASLPVCTP